MRRVLFIAYLYPPIANSGTRRSLSFVNHLPDHGWQPLVLTLADPPVGVCDKTLLSEVREGTSIHRVPLGSALMAQRMSRVFGSGALGERIGAALEWRFSALTQVPDEVASWYPLAVSRGVALHRDTGFDLVYASGWPWTSFLVARAIARRTGCPYVLDYRDLWKPTGTHAWEASIRARTFLNPWLERRAARHAAAVVTVTPTLAQMIRKDASIDCVHCITNGYEPADFTRSPSKEASLDAGSTIRIVYTGVWRPGYGLSDLYGAIRCLKERRSSALLRLRVSAAGFTPGPAREFEVDDIVLELGPVPHAEVLSLMKVADALYLPVPTGVYSKASLPGKLFEYLGSDRPIIAAVPADSEVARVIDDVGGSVRTEPGDHVELAALLDCLCSSDPGTMFSARRPGRLARYTRDSTTGMLAQVFDAAHRGVVLEPLT